MARAYADGSVLHICRPAAGALPAARRAILGRQMSTDAGRQPLPASRTARVVRDLDPGYFSFVMAAWLLVAAAFARSATKKAG